MRLVLLSSGPHTAAALHALISPSSRVNTPEENVICVTSTHHDISISGLRFTPDLDATVRALGDNPRSPASHHVLSCLTEWGLAPRGDWPELEDAAVATAVARNFHLARGLSATEAAARQAEDAGVSVPVLPVTEEPVELHVIEDLPDGERRGRHALRWIHDPERASAAGFVIANLDLATPAPGVLDAIRTADVVVLGPMSPMLDAAGLLGVGGVRDALRGTSATVAVLSPVSCTQGYPGEIEEAAWAQASMPRTSASVARLYSDFADLLVIDENEPSATYPKAIRVERAPLLRALGHDDDASDAAQQLRSFLMP